MRRAEIIKRIRKIAKTKGVTMELVEGRNHTKVTFNGKLVTEVPRHNEVNEYTAKGAIASAENWTQQEEQ